MFLKDMALDVVMVVAYTVDALAHSHVSDFNSARSILSLLPAAITAALWFFFVCHEVAQFFKSKNGIVEYFTGSIWNAMDFLSLSLILATFAIRAVEWGPDATFKASSVALAFGLPVAYMNLLKYMQGFRVSGELVSMIIGIIRGTVAFTAILAVIVVGFALGFYVLFRQGSGDAFGQTSVGMAMLSGYTLMLGDFDVENYTETGNFLAAVALFVVFMFLVNIVMLNLLIAIMGDIFDQVQESALAQFLYSKSSLILEFEATMSEEDKRNENYFPPWLQVLMPTASVGGADDSWAGKMRDLKREITKANENTKVQLEAAQKAAQKETQAQLEAMQKEAQAAQKEAQAAQKETQAAQKEAQAAQKETQAQLEAVQALMLRILGEKKSEK